MSQSDRQKIDTYLQAQKLAQQAYKEARQDQSTYGGTTYKREKTAPVSGSISSLGRQARAQHANAQGNAFQAAANNFGNAFARFGRGQPQPKPAPEPKTLKLPKEDINLVGGVGRAVEGGYGPPIPKGLDTSDEAPPPPKDSYEKPEKPKKFQQVQDAARRKQLAQLGSVERLGHNISRVGQQANAVTASWPYIPGGVVFPLVLLAILVFLLLPVNGKTRIQWLWAVIQGTAAVNPTYVPPQPSQPPTGSLGIAGSAVNNEATGSGSGPIWNTNNKIGNVPIPTQSTHDSAYNIDNPTNSHSYYQPSYYTSSEYEFDEL